MRDIFLFLRFYLTYKFVLEKKGGA